MPRLTEEMFSVSRGPRCHTAVFLATLDTDDRDLVERKLADISYPGTKIRATLVNAGFPNVPGVEALRRHRKGECACRNA